MESGTRKPPPKKQAQILFTFSAGTYDSGDPGAPQGSTLGPLMTEMYFGDDWP